MEMSQVAVLVVGILCFGTGIAGMYVVWRACGYHGIRIVKGPNSGEKAAAKFIDVVERAERRLIIHDDGDKVQGTIYNDAPALAILEKRLEAKPELHVAILFNERHDLEVLKLKDRFGARCQVRYRDGGRPKGDIHYKIADDAMGYFSEHELGGNERSTWLYDLTRASRRARREMFGNHFRLFQQEFDRASPA